MGRVSRRGEPLCNAAALERYGLPLIGEIAPPGTIEGGDLIRLDDYTLQSALGRAPMMQVLTNFSRYWVPLSRFIASLSLPLAIPRMYST